MKNPFVSSSGIGTLVGGAVLLAGSASVISMLAGGAAIIDTPTHIVVDALVSAVTAAVGYSIIRSGSGLAALMGAGWVITLLGAGWVNFDGKQAVNIGTAVVQGVKTAAVQTSVTAQNGSASTHTANGLVEGMAVHNGYIPAAPLSAQAVADCIKPNAPAWRYKAAGVRNCTAASDGNFYVWTPVK